MSEGQVDPREALMVSLPPFRTLLADLVEKSGLSAEDFSRACGLKPGKIPNLLAGTEVPDGVTIDEIAFGRLSPVEWDRLRASAGLLPYELLNILDVDDAIKAFIRYREDKSLRPFTRRRIKRIHELLGMTLEDLKQQGKEP